MEIKFPKLKTENIVLRPFNPDDFKIVFRWQSNTDNLYLWWADRTVLPFDEFVADFQRRLKGSIHQIFMVDVIESDEKAKTVGMVYNYQTNMVDKFTYLCVYLIPEYTAQGIGTKAGYLFTDYLFSNFGFRKIYSEIFDFNQPSLKASTRNNFKEEGCLKNHRWFGDRYWDLHLLALTADDFKKIRPLPQQES